MTQKIDYTDPKWLKSMEGRSCLACGADNSIGHHLYHKRPPRGRDMYAVPLCGKCHQNLHNSTSEALWWAARVPDIVKQAMLMWAERFYEENKDD